MKYHHFHRFFTYSVIRGLASASLRSFKHSYLVAVRLSPKTLSGGEFDWGGTSVKS